jgi:deoxyadenosine/deoxycytidine kinase
MGRLRSPVFAFQNDRFKDNAASPPFSSSTADEPPSPKPVIGIVGPCAAGKSTLVSALIKYGYPQVRHIAQEHSYVPYMWQRIAKPDLLIFLDVSYPLTLSRRKMNWTEAEYAEQIFRLRHARQHANLIIQTDNLPPSEVLHQVITFLHSS